MNGAIASIEAGYGLFPDFSESPEVPPGEQVKLRVNWSAQADDTNWTSAVVAYNASDPQWEILDEQTERHIATSDSGQVILNLFSMPTYPVTLAVVLWGHRDYLFGSFPAGRTDWIQLAYKTITVIPHVTVYAGTIETKQMEVFPPGFGSEMYDIPVSGAVAEGSDGKIHVWVRNTGNIEFHPCITWKVSSPSSLIKDYSECKALSLNPDDTHHFYEVLERFDIDEVGEWTVEIELVAEETGQILDQWTGKLCLVEAQADEGAIEFMELEIKDTGAKESIPVEVEIPKGSEAKVHVHVRNTGLTNYHGRCIWNIRDDRGYIIAGGHYDSTSFTVIHPGETHEFWESVAWFTFYREGEHSINVEFRAVETGELLDTYSGRLCLVGAEVGPACEIDADCPPGYRCEGGVCVPEGGGELIFSGIVSGVEPAIIGAGEPITLQISWEAETSALFEQINGWRARAIITLDGMEEDIASSTLFGASNTGIFEVTFPGVMQQNMNGHITLSCLKAGFSDYEERVDERDFAISLIGAACEIDADCPEGYVCKNGVCVPEGEPGKFPVLPVVLIAGGVIAAAVSLGKPKFPTTSKK